MYAEKDEPGGDPPCSAVAALTVVVVGLVCWGGSWLLAEAGPPTVSAVESRSLLAPLVLFAAVGAVLLVAGLNGLCRWSRQLRTHHATRDPARYGLGREPRLLQRR